LSQTRASRDIAIADSRAALEQVIMRTEAITMAEADLAIAEAGVRNADAVVEQKQAALDQAKLDLARSVIRAPIDGVILKRDVDPGQTVAVTLEAKTLFKVAKDLRKMVVHARVDEADVGHLTPGQRATFTVDAFPDHTFGGEVLEIRKFPDITQNVVCYTATISAPNELQLLLPGMTADLRIVVSDSGDVLKIPNEALRFRPPGANSVAASSALAATSNAPAAGLARGLVWITGRAGRPEPVSVRTGLSDDTGTELLEGSLGEGQRVIVGVGHQQVASNLFGIRLGF
jgi:HlyD family secretion protein